MALPIVQVYAGIAVQDIRELIAGGVIQADQVSDFTDLDKFVDRNALGRLCEPGFAEQFGTHEAGTVLYTRFCEQVADLVDRWIKDGGHLLP